MIPKRIHYCWFGGEKYPRIVEKCMESWKKYCPDYEIVRWDEHNSSLKDNDYVQQAYAAQKWAFVSDYVRIKALEDYGGIYLDTDVELRKPLDVFLQNYAFCGFESKQKVAMCLIAAEPNHPFLKRIIDLYAHIPFFLRNGSFDETTNVQRITNLLVDEGLVLDNSEQTVCGMTIYPHQFFSPKDLENGRVTVTEHTVTIHHFQASWMSPKQRFHTRIAQLIGPKYTKKVKELIKR